MLDADYSTFLTYSLSHSPTHSPTYSSCLLPSLASTLAPKMFEHRRQRLVPRNVFYARLARSAALAFLIVGNAKFAIADFDKSISLDDHNPLVFAERGYARQTQGMSSEAQKDFEHGLKLNNDLRLMLDLHLLDLQMQIKEMERRQSVIKKNIA